jgi:hypothetical protein
MSRAGTIALRVGLALLTALVWTLWLTAKILGAGAKAAESGLVARRR